MRVGVRVVVLVVVAAACSGGAARESTTSSSPRTSATTSVATTTPTTTTTTAPTATTAPATTIAATTEPPALDDETMERAVAFVNTHNAGDVDAFVAMHAPGAVVRERDAAGMGTLPEEKWIAEYVWKAGVDYRLELGTCWKEGAVAACSVKVRDVMLDAAGVTWNQHSIRLEWDDAGLVTFFETTGHLYWADVVLSPIRTFREWVRANHPEEAELMFARGNFLYFTPEAAELWQQLAPEFAVYMGNG